MARYENGVAVPLAYGADWSERQMYGDELVELVESAFGPVRIAFTLRYADFPGQGHAVLTREEYESHLSAAIRSWLIYQRYERDPDGGEAGGREYGRAAVTYAQEIGYQLGDPIFACADRPAGSFDLDVAEKFFAGFAAEVRAAGYLAGGYGFWDVIYRLQDRDVVDVLWLCGAQSRWRPGIHLYQWNNGRIYPGKPRVPTDLCMQFEEITGANDMELKELIDFRPDLGGAPRNLWDGIKQVLTNQGVHTAMLEVLATSQGHDPDQINAAVDAAVKKYTPTPEQIAQAQEATIAPIVESALRRVQDTDNLDEAKQTVAELLRQISTLAAPADTSGVSAP